MLMCRAKLILKRYLKLFSFLLRAVKPWEVLLLLPAEGIRLGVACGLGAPCHRTLLLDFVAGFPFSSHPSSFIWPLACCSSGSVPLELVLKSSAVL